jgi:hypothetical protein
MITIENRNTLEVIQVTEKDWEKLKKMGWERVWSKIKDPKPIKSLEIKTVKRVKKEETKKED